MNNHTTKRQNAERQLALWKHICKLPITIDLSNRTGNQRRLRIKLYPEVDENKNFRIHIHLTPEMAEYCFNHLKRQLEDNNPNPGLAFDFSLFQAGDND